jgi:hypothetical protein
VVGVGAEVAESEAVAIAAASTQDRRVAQGEDMVIGWRILREYEGGRGREAVALYGTLPVMEEAQHSPAQRRDHHHSISRGTTQGVQ